MLMTKPAGEMQNVPGRHFASLLPDLPTAAKHVVGCNQAAQTLLCALLCVLLSKFKRGHLACRSHTGCRVRARAAPALDADPRAHYQCLHQGGQVRIGVASYMLRWQCASSRLDAAVCTTHDFLLTSKKAWHGS